MNNALKERLFVAVASHCANEGRAWALVDIVLAELAGELGDGTCEWWEDGEMWESSCGVAYMFNSDGPEDNGHTFCHKCGNRIAIDEARGSMIVR